MDVTINGVEEVNELLSEISPHLYKQTKKALSSSLFKIHEKIVLPLQVGANGLQSRTGNLAKSIKQNVKGNNLNTLSGNLYTNSPYAPTHELGATIKGKDKYRFLDGRAYLNIPLSPNKTAVGVMRKTSRQVFDEGGYIYKSRQGNWLVALNGKNMFVLKHQVSIPARLKMVQRTEEQIPTLLSDLNDLIFASRFL